MVWSDYLPGKSLLDGGGRPNKSLLFVLQPSGPDLVPDLDLDLSLTIIIKHFDRLNQVRPSGDKRRLLFQFMTEIFVDVTRMNHGQVKTPDVHDPLLPHSAFDLPAVTA